MRRWRKKNIRKTNATNDATKNIRELKIFVRYLIRVHGKRILSLALHTHSTTHCFRLQSFFTRVLERVRARVNILLPLGSDSKQQQRDEHSIPGRSFIFSILPLFSFNASYIHLFGSSSTLFFCLCVCVWIHIMNVASISDFLRRKQKKKKRKEKETEKKVSPNRNMHKMNKLNCGERTIQMKGKIAVHFICHPHIKYHKYVLCRQNALPTIATRNWQLGNNQKIKSEDALAHIFHSHTFESSLRSQHKICSTVETGIQIHVDHVQFSVFHSLQVPSHTTRCDADAFESAPRLLFLFLSFFLFLSGVVLFGSTSRFRRCDGRMFSYNENPNKYRK